MKFFLSLLFDLVLLVVYGAVFSKLWDWFIVTQFQVDQLSVAMAAGIAITIAFLTNQVHPNLDDIDTVDFISQKTLAPILALVSGWLVLKFI